MTADGGAEPGLVAHIRLQRSDFRLEADVRVAPGEVVAVLGPNGAGKSTLLRALAGLVPLASGFVRVDGQPWDEPDRGVFAPPDRRAVGMVFQDHLLFPHLTVADNVAFGPRMRGEGRAVARTEALEWLGRVGLAELAERRPGRCPGGRHSGSRSPARWPPGPGCSCWTSRWPRWTWPRAPTSGPCCATISRLRDRRCWW